MQSPSLLSQAEKNPKLEFQFREKPWNVYKTVDEPVKYVDIPNKPPRAINSLNWRQDFWEWFTHYKKNDEFLIVDNESRTVGTTIKDSFRESFDSSKCNAKVDVSFDTLNLSTSCPGHFHILKFAFHSSWRASGGEKLYLTSPGFIGIIPATTSTAIAFGQSTGWTLANILSILTLIALTAYLLRLYIQNLGSLKNGN
jgi:hypothetical protein